MHDPEKREEILKKHEELMPKLRSPKVRARMIVDGLDPEAALKRLADLKDKEDSLEALAVQMPKEPEE